MPRSQIVAADSVPDFDLIPSGTKRLVVIGGAMRSWWGPARVISVSPGTIVTDHENGVAVVAACGVSDTAIREAVELVPNKLVVVVLEKAPGSTLKKALAKRGCTVIVPSKEGPMHIGAVNDVDSRSIQTRSLSAPSPEEVEPEVTEAPPASE